MAAASKILLIFSQQDGKILNYPGLPMTKPCPMIATSQKSLVVDARLLISVSIELQSDAVYCGYHFHMSFQDDDKKFLFVILHKGDLIDTETECDADVPVADQSCVRNDGWDGPAENDAHGYFHGNFGAESVWVPPVIRAAETSSVAHNREDDYNWDDSCHAHPLRTSATTPTRAYPNPLVRRKRTHKPAKKGYAGSWYNEPSTVVSDWCTDGGKKNRDWDTGDSVCGWDIYDESNHDNRPDASILTPESTEADSTVKPEYYATVSSADYDRRANGVTGVFSSGYCSTFDASEWRL
ncbi:uncharacterized protein KD926_006695 [Aspergillus affinis]|uniref:uncharacterized protein n=1 Tax=Aspergillus affinis TaxID=1070780 RepID=UPI0022FDBD51|nr:uncharacterized protein KD926_006695 [Aspergillus affinis]KAI9041621.1 hypothetical protein KD926_006695 [Aspergillus affinis]